MKKWIITYFLMLFSVNAYGGYPYSMTYTVSPGDTILADHYNTANNEHINNNIPESIDDYSSSVVEMQGTTDPYPAGVESQPTTLDGELERIRYVIKQITGESQWYIDPLTDLNSVGTEPIMIGARCVFDGTGTPTYTEEVNFSGAITDNAVGDWTLTIDTDFATSTYSSVATINDGLGTKYVQTGSHLVGSLSIYCFSDFAGTKSDSDKISVVLVGAR
jgi:hypothetical protein